jgi:flagellar M-ring protein FliF
MRDEVIRILTATNQFSSIDAAVNVVLDNSYTENANHLYWAPEGREEGMLASKDLYNSTNEGGISGEPGTDSNTETSYQYEDNQYSSSAVTEESYDYLPDESTMLQQIPAGAIKYDQSSLSVTTLTYRMVREDDVKEQGLLDGITWEQYKINNDARTKLEVDPDLIQAVSTATGIGVKNITILSYEEPFFIDHTGLAMDLTDILTLVLIVLIMGLLAFVIFRSMRQAGQEEVEPEVSIDEILQSTPQEELEEIGVEDKSEARKIVEKFVEDNPDAAANLLRNWLNEDM